MATIRDVAHGSKVSIATVSRVFNESALVSEATRRKVLAVASRLGYWPNGIARSLITNRTHALGVLMPDFSGEFFSEVVHGMDVAARERGFHLLVSRSSSNAEELTAAVRSVHGRVEGLIVMAPDFDATPVIRPWVGRMPTVFINPGHTSATNDSVSIANAEGARLVVRHLLDLGHRSIAIITGPEFNFDSLQRREGYRSALRQAGIEPDPAFELAGDFSEHSGFEAAERMLRLKARPSALFASNDYMAVGALGALHDAGVRVPEDLAIAGFDDIPLAHYINPALTTVRVDIPALGRRAVQLLLDPRPAHDPGAVHETLPTTLVVRSSCGAGSRGVGESRGTRSAESPAPQARR
jgi:LacI family transcriptional regulator